MDTDELCMYGMLRVAEADLSHFKNKYFFLDTQKRKLFYYNNMKQKMDLKRLSAPHTNEAEGSYGIACISMIQPENPTKPQLKHLFSITVVGDKKYLQAENETQKHEWIKRLKDAVRMTIGEAVSGRASWEENALLGGFKTTIEGDVVVRTPIQSLSDSDSSDSELSSSNTSENQDRRNAIIKGYAIKQGVFRKSWKERYFILSSSGLGYYKSDICREPIRFIKKADMKEARQSVGIHTNRENIMEIVTPNRVFYMQFKNEEMRQEWIMAINQLVGASLKKDKDKHKKENVQQNSAGEWI